MNKIVIDTDKIISLGDIGVITDKFPSTIWRWRQQGLKELEIKIPAGSKRHSLFFNFASFLKWMYENNKPMPSLDKWLKEKADM